MKARLKMPFLRLTTLGLLALSAAASLVQAQAPITLFGTTNDVVNFRSAGGGNVPWTLTSSNSILVVPGTGNIQSTQTYGDFILHAEFLLPATGNGNCGLFLQGRYEVQIFNSFGAVTLNANDCGSIFGQSPPAINACLAPGVWQSYDIIFHQPRWSGNTKLSNARATVVLNGVTVQNNVQITGSTSASTGPEGPTPGPLVLQDNGSDVELRNIQILPINATASLINGSFEMAPITTNIVLTNSSTLVSGWSVGSTGPLSFVTGPSFGVSPLDGNQMLEFNSGNTLAGDTISQTFPTTPGQSYTVSFNVARTPANVAGTVSLRGTVTSSTGQTLGTLNSLAPSSGWSAAQTFTFAATTPTSTLTFLDTSLTTVAVDALLDNVSVTTAIAPPSGIVAWWKGEGNALDSVSTNHALSTNLAYTTGKVRQAFDHNGNNSVFRVPASPSLNVGAGPGFTVELWLQPRSLQSMPVVEWHNLAGTVPPGFVAFQGGIRSHLWLNTTFGVPNSPGSLYVNLIATNGVNHYISSPLNLVRAFQWQHVAMTYQQANGALNIFLDGNIVASTNLPGNPVIHTSDDFLAGYRPTGNGQTVLDGSIDELSLYNRALSQSEIQNIVNAGSAGKSVGVGGNSTNTIVYDLIARMDGSQDTLIFRDGTLQWNHIANGAGAPGRSLGLNVPTTISSSLNGVQVMNMVDWIPTWPLPVPDNIRFDAVSSVFTNLTPVLPSGGILSVSVTNVSARGSLAVVQMPDATNGQTLIVNYADGQIGSGYVTGRVTVVSLAVPPGPPVVTQPPATLRVVPGTNVTFTVGLSGPGPFSYQWRFNGINIPGANASTLGLNNVQTANNGYYTVVVTNAYGTILSPAGSLEVLTAPAITTHPIGATNLAGDAVSFSVEATGSSPLFYQWQRNGLNVPGALGSTLILDAVSVTSAGLYSVIVSNAAGVAVSSNAMLAVSSAPVIITPPAARIVNATAPVSFTVAALGDAPFTYQWRLNGMNLAGATSATFSIAAATPSHEGLYTVAVSNALGFAISPAARLTVLPVSVVVPWAAGNGGPGSDVGHAIAVDAAGNSYVAGHFTGTATFGTNTLVSAGNTDIFIAKHNSNGQLLWVRRAGGPGYDVAKGIAVDAAGNCHVTGAYEGEAAFSPTNSLINTSPTSYADAFVAKFDTAGTLVWARSAGVEFTNDEGTAVAVDSAGNVLVTGRSVLDTFAGGPVANTGRIFVAKYDSAGTEVWARKAGSYSGGNLDTGTGIAADSAGNVFVGGVFYSPVAAFGAGSFTNLGYADMFLAKFDAAGTLQWARQAGGAGEDTASGVAVAADGSAYLVGALGGNANFSGSNVTSLAGAASDGFIAKYAPSGSVTWVRQMGGSGVAAARAVAVDAAGTVHVTGYFSGGAAFGTNSLGGISGSYDAFVTRLDPSGVFAFAQQAGGADLSGDFGLGVGADAAGNSFITGYFSGTSSIGGGSLPSRGGEDVLVTRFNQFTGGGQPQLGLLRNGPQFRMRWPLASSSYILQSTTNLLAPVWRDETNALTLNGTELETDVAPGSTVKFYRLRKP